MRARLEVGEMSLAMDARLGISIMGREELLTGIELDNLLFGESVIRRDEVNNVVLIVVFAYSISWKRQER